MGCSQSDSAVFRDHHSWFNHSVDPLRRDIRLLDGSCQVSRSIQVEALAGRDHGRGAVFGDDGGAGVFSAGVELVSGVELRGEFLAVE